MASQMVQFMPTVCVRLSEEAFEDRTLLRDTILGLRTLDERQRPMHEAGRSKSRISPSRGGGKGRARGAD